MRAVAGGIRRIVSRTGGGFLEWPLPDIQSWADPGHRNSYSAGPRSRRAPSGNGGWLPAVESLLGIRHGLDALGAGTGRAAPACALIVFA